MKQLIKFLKPILVAIGLVLIFESIVFPGLTVANTITNVLALLAGIIACYFAFTYYKLCYFTKPKEEVPLQAKGGEIFFKDADVKVKLKRKPKTQKQ